MNPEVPNQDSPQANPSAPLPQETMFVAPTTTDPNQMPPSSQPNQNGTATIALVLSCIAMIAWLFPLLGVPVAIAALVLSIKAHKANKKLSQVALVLAVIGLFASIVNAGIGAYMGAKGELFFQKKQSDATNSQNMNPQEGTPQVYPETSQNAFVEGCVGTGGTAVQCACILGEIQKNFTYDEFIAFDKQTSETGQVPEELNQVIEGSKITCK